VRKCSLPAEKWKSHFELTAEMSEKVYIIPPNRTRYLSEISETCRNYDSGWTNKQRLRSGCTQSTSPSTPSTQPSCGQGPAHQGPRSDALRGRPPAHRGEHRYPERLAGEGREVQSARVHLPGARPRHQHRNLHREPFAHHGAEDRAPALRRMGRHPALESLRKRAGEFPYAAGSTTSSAKAKIPRACSRAKALPNEPTAASTT
jgi:hypothetical protein